MTTGGPGDFARIDPPSDTSSTLCGLSDASVGVDISVPGVLPKPRNTAPSSSDSPVIRSNPFGSECCSVSAWSLNPTDDVNSTAALAHDDIM